MRLATCHPEKKHYCKGLCATCYQARRYEINPDHREYMKGYLKNYRAQNPEKVAKLEAKRRADPEKRKRDAITKKNCAYRKKYGITLTNALEILERQGGGCALCKTALSEATMKVDHCHDNGHVRGILCNKCNVGLGQLGDTLEALMNAVKYVSDRKTELLAQSIPAGSQQ